MTVMTDNLLSYVNTLALCYNEFTGNRIFDDTWDLKMMQYNVALTKATLVLLKCLSICSTSFQCFAVVRWNLNIKFVIFLAVRLCWCCFSPIFYESLCSENSVHRPITIRVIPHALISAFIQADHQYCRAVNLVINFSSGKSFAIKWSLWKIRC